MLLQTCEKCGTLVENLQRATFTISEGHREIKDVCVLCARKANENTNTNSQLLNG